MTRIPRASQLFPLLIALASSGALASDGLRREEARASSFGPGAQAHAALAFDRDGGTVVVWDSRRQEQGGYGIYLQRFGKSGDPIGTESRVNVRTSGQQSQPAIAIDGQGGTWVAWESFGQDGSGSAVVARRLAPGADTAEILVNETTEGDQGQVTAAAAADGSVLLAWTTPDGSAAATRVMGRILDARGRPITRELRIAPSAGRQALPTAAATISGFVVAWAVADDAGCPYAIRAQRLGARGQAIGPEIAVSDVDGWQHVEPSISTRADGTFAIAWMSTPDDAYAVCVRTFGPDGAPASPARIASARGGPRRSGAAVALGPGSRIAVAWNEGDDIVLLDPDDGSPMRVNAQAAGHHRLEAASGNQRIAFGADGRIGLAWSGDSGLGDDNAANVTLLLPAGVACRLTSPTELCLPASTMAAGPIDPPIYDPSRIIHLPYGGDATPFPEGADFGFVGVTDTGWYPPDPSLAVGPGYIVQTTNGAIAIFDKTGTNVFQQPIEGGGGFWGSVGAGGFVFDPEVIFDTQSNRFFAMAAEQVGTTAGRFLLAVSDDADPNGTWYKYAFDVTAEAGDYYIDSPNIAVDSQAVYLTADFFSPTDKYLVHILNKADVLAGNPPASTFLLITGRQSFGLPVTYDPAAPAQYMIEAIESGTPTIVRLHAITNPLGTPSRVETTLTVPAYTIPPEDPPQMGTSTRPELFEARFWSCTYRNGSLWAVHHENSSRVRVRWYEVKMNGWPATSAPSLAQEGEIDLGGTIRTFFPSIWTDAAGNAAITFARSSPTEFISMNRALRLATDPPNTFGGIQTEQTGSTYNDSGRWGDYSGTMSDPAMPGSFWGVHEYAVGTSAWNTWIARYDAPACPLITLSPAALPAGSVGTPYSQTITASGGTTPYTFAVTAGTLPPGLALAAGGVLSGTPTTAGSSTFTVTATDSASCQGQLAYTLVIGNPVDYVVGNGLGFPNPNSVRVYTAAGTATPTNFQAYGAGQWGTVVSAGDVNGGGRDEILTGPGPGAVYGPHVRAFDNTGTGLGKVSYFAYGTLRYGVNVARARLDADAYDEILTGAGAGPVFGPHVRGWNFDNTTITALAKVSFFAYGTLQWGVNVEDGDVDADGYSEILTGPGPGPSFAPQIRGFDYDGNSIAAIAKINFGAFPTTGYGVNVAGATVEADAYDEIAAAPGPGPTSSFPSRFRGFNYDAATISALPGFDITPFTTFYGGRVGLGDFTLDGVCELIAGAGPDPVATAVVDAFAYNGSALTAIPGSGFVPFAGTFGVNVGAGFLGF